MNQGKAIKTVLATLLVLPLLLATHAAIALTSDGEQAIEIEADEFLLDDAQKFSVYTGSVVLTQGSIRVSGSRLTVKYDENDEIHEMLVDGKLARFKQQADSGEWTDGESLRIEYFPQKEELFLLKKARVKQGGKVFSGDRIIYDIAKSVVKAHSTSTHVPGADAGDKPQKRERVKIVLPPRQKKQN